MTKYKNVLLATLFIALSQLAVAQISGGIKGGINFPWEPGQIPRFSASLGGIVEYSVTDQFFLQSGLQITGKGYYVMGFNTFGGDTQDYTVRVTYLELPFMLGIKTNNRSPHIFCAGLFCGYAVNGQIKTTRLKFGYDPDDDYKPIDFGFIMGYGIEMYKKTQLLLSYERGLTDIYPGEFSAHSNLVSISFSVLLGDGK